MEIKKICGILALCSISLMVAAPFAMAASRQDAQAQLKALQAQINDLQKQSRQQIDALQAQVDLLKEQTAQKAEEKETVLSKLELQSQPAPKKPGFGRVLESDEKTSGLLDNFLVRKPRKRTGIMGWMQRNKKFRVGDAMGLDEESPVNIAFEINSRYRQDIHSKGSSHGFQFYEAGLIADAELNDWTAGYVEYNLHHSTQSEAEDVWIDLHLPDGPKAFDGGTGLKIGHFHAPFGWDNDDCEGSFYGGRTTVNAPLMRHERFEGQILRERQEGVQANYNLELDDLRVIFTGAVFNGNGDSLHYGGSDNDSKKDWVARVETHLFNTAIGASYWHSPSTGGATATVNDTSHPRELNRYGVHFKYPNEAPFPGGDPALGDSKFLIWGEAMYAYADAASTVQAQNSTVEAWGGYLEGDISLIKDKLLAFCRVDYWEPNTDLKGKEDITGITPGIYLTLWPGLSVLTLEYEFYQGGTQDDNDRVAAELQIFF